MSDAPSREDLEARAKELGIKFSERTKDETLVSKIEEAEAAPGPTITVRGPKEGRRRAGRAFTPEPVTIPMSELSEDQIEALTNDPKLSVVIAS